MEQDESSADAALREFAEELGTRRPCDMIGQLQDCYVFASDFLITPWLAATNARTELDHRRPTKSCASWNLPLDVLLDPQPSAAWQSSAVRWLSTRLATNSAKIPSGAQPRSSSPSWQS